MHRSSWLVVVLLIGLAFWVRPVASADESSPFELNNAFFAFDNGTGRGELPLADQAAILAELGYDGIGFTGTANIPEMLRELDRRALTMFSTYVGATIGKDGPRYDPQLPTAIKQLAGRSTDIWLTIRGGLPTSPESDAQAVAVVREIAELAAASGLRVVLYPHTGFYVARTDDALRIAKQVNRDNVGVSLNLCHWLKTDGPNDLESLVKRAMPRLMLVSINGADDGPTQTMNWNRLIQPLDRGSFDVLSFLKTLKRCGYNGPIGLQCYQIPGDRRTNLQRSIGAWRHFQRTLAGKPPADDLRTLVIPRATADSLHLAVTSYRGKQGETALLKTPDGKATALAQYTPTPGTDGTVTTATTTLVAKLTLPADSTNSTRWTIQPVPAKKQRSKGHWLWEDVNDTSLVLRDNQQPVLAYNYGTIVSDAVPESDVRKQRSSYIHPLYGLDSEILTDDFPKDHYHHHGVFWTWPHVIIDDKEYDLWVGRGIKQKFLRWLVREDGPVAAVLAVENGWFVEDRQVAVERIWLRIYHGDANGRVIDFDGYWIPIERALTLQGAPGKSYGGFTVRFAPRQETVITVPEGRTTEDLKETHLRWADFSARFAGRDQSSGIHVLVHPHHPDYPPTWLTRHYGALCVGWPGVEARSFPPGRPFHLQYRMWIHRGLPEVEVLKTVGQAYRTAVEARWVADPEN